MKFLSADKNNDAFFENDENNSVFFKNTICNFAKRNFFQSKKIVHLRLEKKQHIFPQRIDS